MENLFQILEWDSHFFGFAVAQILPQSLSKDELSDLLKLLKSQKIRLAYWPSGITSESEIKQVEHLGGTHVDTKTTFKIDLQHKAENDFPRFDFISEYDKPNANKELIQLAIESGTYSRFKTDKKIGTANFERLYTSWIEESVSKKIAKAVLVSTHDEKVTGMVTLGKKNGIGDIGLIAVDGSQRGKGTGHALIQASLLWFFKNGYPKVQVVTQVTNEAACKLYEKNGFAIASSQPFFHFWI